MNLLTAGLIPLRNLMNNVFEILFKSLDNSLDLALLGLRPGRELVGWNDLSIASERQGKAERGTQHDDALLSGSLA